MTALRIHFLSWVIENLDIVIQHSSIHYEDILPSTLLSPRVFFRIGKLSLKLFWQVIFIVLNVTDPKLSYDWHIWVHAVSRRSVATELIFFK